MMQREVDALSAIVDHPKRADAVCLGGAMAFPFLAAQVHALLARRPQHADQAGNIAR